MNSKNKLFTILTLAGALFLGQTAVADAGMLTLEFVNRGRPVVVTGMAAGFICTQAERSRGQCRPGFSDMFVGSRVTIQGNVTGGHSIVKGWLLQGSSHRGTGYAPKWVDRGGSTVLQVPVKRASTNVGGFFSVPDVPGMEESDDSSSYEEPVQPKLEDSNDESTGSDMLDSMLNDFEK